MKLSHRQDLLMTAPHAVEVLLRTPPSKRLMNWHMPESPSIRLWYLIPWESLLLRMRLYTLRTCSLTLSIVLRQYLIAWKQLKQQMGLWDDLKDAPIPCLDNTVFTDGSSFIKRGSAMLELPSHWLMERSSGHSHNQKEHLTRGLNL